MPQFFFVAVLNVILVCCFCKWPDQRNTVKNIFQGQLPGNFINLKHSQLVKQAMTLILGKLRSNSFLGTLPTHYWYLGISSFFLKKGKRTGIELRDYWL